MLKQSIRITCTCVNYLVQLDILAEVLEAFGIEVIGIHLHQSHVSYEITSIAIGLLSAQT